MASRFSLIGGSQSPEFVEKRSSIVITEDIELIKMQSAEYEPEAVRVSISYMPNVVFISPL